MSPDDQGSGETRASRPSPRPTREEILAARRSRRVRAGLYVFSLSWAFFATYAMGVWSSWYESLPSWREALILSPAVLAGLVAGRRVWPAYFFAVLVVSPTLLFGWDPFTAVLLVSATILVLGYAALGVYCLLRGRRWVDPYPREADAPRGVGGASTESGGLRWKGQTTVKDSAPTGRELRKRWY